MIKKKQNFSHWLTEALQIPEGNFDEKTNFLSLGLDSIQLVEASRKIGKILNIKLYPTIFFEYQTPKEFEQYLRENYLSELERLLLLN